MGCPTIQLHFDPICQETASDPHVKGSVLQVCPLNFLLQTPVASPDCHLCCDWLTVDWRPVNPSLGSVKLLEWLRELNETFYLLDDEFIRKVYDSGTARWKRQLEPVQVKGPELPCPFWAQHFFLISTYSPTPKLCKAYPFGFLHRQVWLNHWPGKLIQPSNPLLFRRVKVNGLESFKPLISMQILASLTWLKIS